MQVSIIRQTPAASILLTLLIVVATFVRFALAPYGDELISSGVATLGAKVDSFQSTYPVWGWIFSAVIVLLNSVSVGRTASALGLYQPRTTISIPLYAIVACGIFIATDSLAVGLASLFSVQMMRYLCGGYVRGTDLNYAGAILYTCGRKKYSHRRKKKRGGYAYGFPYPQDHWSAD